MDELDVAYEIAEAIQEARKLVWIGPCMDPTKFRISFESKDGPWFEVRIGRAK